MQTVPHRIALVGGPLGGKTTVMEYLQQTYANKARFVAEVASMLLNSGYPKLGVDVSNVEEWMNYINKTILPTQVNMENGNFHAAASSGLRAVFVDRGVMDPAGYLDGGKQELEEKFGVRADEGYARYTMVIHLESLACIDEAEYERLKGTNPARYDTAPQAKMRDAKIREAWRDHPNWHLVSAEGGIQKIIAQVAALVGQYLDVEIEKKYVITKPSDEFLSQFKSEEITQFYVIDEKNGEMRFRGTESGYHEITVKTKGTLSRMEWQCQVPEDVFNLAKNAYNWPTIKKRRYLIPYETHILELDVYSIPDNLFDCTVECEFETEAEAEQFALPSYLGEAKDVTDDPAWKNAALAKDVRWSNDFELVDDVIREGFML